MKKTWILTIGLILLAFLSACSGENKQDIYGVYEFEKISYLSPAISTIKEYLESLMNGKKCTVEKNLFKAELIDKTVEFTSPKYTKEEVFSKTPTLSDIHTLVGNDIDYQYVIYDKDGNKTGWMLFISSDDLWLGSCVYNDDDSVTIMNLFKFSKVSNR